MLAVNLKMKKYCSRNPNVLDSFLLDLKPNQTQRAAVRAVVRSVVFVPTENLHGLHVLQKIFFGLTVTNVEIGSTVTVLSEEMHLPGGIICAPNVLEFIILLTQILHFSFLQML